MQDKGTDVPCGTCKACCTSSYFIQITPQETETLAHIPKELLFPVPGLPKGHMLLGYDQQGRCPMLTEKGCSIYQYRPKTCRSYDCRIFAAAGISAGEEDKNRVTQQVRQWQFSYPAPEDRIQHAAVKKAATFLQEHAKEFPFPIVPTKLALMAIKVYDVFLDKTEADTAHSNSDKTTVQAVLDSYHQFESLSEETLPLDKKNRNLSKK